MNDPRLMSFRLVVTPCGAGRAWATMSYSSLPSRLVVRVVCGRLRSGSRWKVSNSRAVRASCNGLGTESTRKEKPSIR